MENALDKLDDLKYELEKAYEWLDDHKGDKRKSCSSRKKVCMLQKACERLRDAYEDEFEEESSDEDDDGWVCMESLVHQVGIPKMEEKETKKEAGQKSLEEPLDNLILPLECAHGVEEEYPLLKITPILSHERMEIGIWREDLKCQESQKGTPHNLILTPTTIDAIDVSCLNEEDFSKEHAILFHKDHEMLNYPLISYGVLLEAILCDGMCISIHTMNYWKHDGACLPIHATTLYLNHARIMMSNFAQRLDGKIWFYLIDYHDGITQWFFLLLCLEGNCLWHFILKVSLKDDDGFLWMAQCIVKMDVFEACYVKANDFLEVEAYARHGDVCNMKLKIMEDVPTLKMHMSISSKISKWVLELQEYDYTFIVEDSTRASLADVLTYKVKEKKITPKAQVKLDLSPQGELEDAYTLLFDGAYRRQRNKAAGEFVILNEEKKEVLKKGIQLHLVHTNNEAEYATLKAGLEEYKSMGIKRLMVKGDALLIVRQVQGTGACKNSKLLQWLHEVKLLMKDFEAIQIQHISRQHNKETGEYKHLERVQRHRLVRKALSYQLIGEHLYHKGKDLVLRRVPLVKEIEKILMSCHDGVCGGHFAQEITSRKILQAGFVWPSLYRDVQHWCNACKACQQAGDRKLSYGPRFPIFAYGPFEKWGIDAIGPLPRTSTGKQYILTATDYMTRWAEAASVARITAADVSKFVLDYICSRFGTPLEILSDRGPGFRADLLDALLENLSIKHVHSTPYYPQCNGLVEKTNGVLCKIITKHVRDRPQDWDKHLTVALWAYRTSFKVSTQFTPYHLVYGQEALLPIEVELGSLRVLARETTSSKEKLEQRILDLQQLELDREQPLTTT
ncbi:hypothetical protein L7F22_024723 [Adiantum nelumboides]|nr:hypothetical protein [Adiantum nelumboides]